MDLLPFALILFVASFLFAWEAYRGVSRGITRFPLQIIAIEEFERGHTMFWGIVGANLLVAIALVGVATTLVLKG